MTNHTVLIIDYEPRSIRAATVPLERQGFTVEVAHDGIAGLRAFDKLRPVLVLIEAMLPKRHGFEVCQEIKKSAHGKATPVVITTGVYRGRKYRSQALHIYGCDEYLEKPFTEEQLLETCRRFLGEVMPDPSKAEAERAKAAPVEVPRAAEQAQRATGTHGPRSAIFAPIVGDLTEQEITARLDAILPGEMRSPSQERASIAPDPAPAEPSTGIAGPSVSSEPEDSRTFDPPEDPRPFERSAEPAADDLADVTADELDGILDALEAREEEPQAGPAIEPEPFAVAIDSEPDRPRRRKKKRSKRQRRESSRAATRPTPTNNRTAETMAPADSAGDQVTSPEQVFAELAAEMQSLETTVARPHEGVDTTSGSALARDSSVTNASESETSAELAETPGTATAPSDLTPAPRKNRTPLWLGIAAVVVIGIGGALFFARRGDDGTDGSTVSKPQETTRRAASVGSREPAGLAQAPVPLPERDAPGGVVIQTAPEKIPEPAAATSIAVTPVEPPAATVRTEPVTAAKTPPAESIDRPAAAKQPAPTVTPSPAIETPVVPEPLPEAARTVDPDAQAERAASVVIPPATRPEPAEVPPRTARGDLVTLQDVDEAPTIVSQTPPEYPVSARRLRQEGTVYLNVLVNEDGNVVDVELIRGVADELDAAAAGAVRSWAYEPAAKDGVDVKVWKPEKVTFKL